MILAMNSAFLWTEKYRPAAAKDAILPPKLKAIFQKFVEDGVVPNLLLCGTSGIGKTTVAKAMLDEMEADYIIINSSKDRGIDVLRNDITDYASSRSFTGKRKYVILDEADYLTPLVQAALRNFMEEFSGNCGFIFTCNFKSKMTDAILSRTSVIDFSMTSMSPESKLDLMGKFLQRVFRILKDEQVEFDKTAVTHIVSKFFPDMRRILNELQVAAGAGKIDMTSVSMIKTSSVDGLIKYMKAKDEGKVRRWIGENADTDTTDFFTTLFHELPTHIPPNFRPAAAIILQKYYYQAAFVASQEINRAACAAELMLEMEWVQ
jgi:replication-associated recombination protein RarA